MPPMPGTDPPTFRIAMAGAGLVAPRLLLDDGRIHRCQVEGKKPSNKSGAYRISSDGIWGGFQNWAEGSPWQPWKAANPSQLTREQRYKFLATQRAGADQERQERAEARRKAEAMWGAAAEGPHPYLDRKGICSNGSRVLGDLLLIPMRDWDGGLHSVQTITSEGEKRFLRGGRMGGCFHWLRIGQTTGPVIYCCEGFATGATIHAATGGRPVVVSFCASNILAVCRVLRENLPRVVLVVCADNDHKTAGNPGVTAATAAAIETGARLAIPQVTQGTDFNDLAAEMGIAEARKQLQNTVKPKKLEEAEERC